MTNHYLTPSPRSPPLVLVILMVICFAVVALADDVETITCSGGWAGDSQQIIPKAWINDGYCDCPYDGKDESNTNACSGSSNWPGVAASVAAGLPETGANDFSCPQQKNLVLPASRVHDGICDCCDGTDEEGYTSCPDVCDEVLRAEREVLAKITNEFLIGSRKRAMDLVQFSERRASELVEVSKLEQELKNCNNDIELIEGTEIVELKRSYVRSRMATMKDKVVASQMATDLLAGLEDSELEDLIVHLCQLSGEIAKANGDTAADDDTCAALRIAAMDMGLSWNDHEDFEHYETSMAGKVNMTRSMMNIVFNNAMDANSKGGSPALPPLRWKEVHSGKKRNKRRRRLDEVLEDDFMEDEWDVHDDAFDHDYHDDHDDFEDRHRDRDLERHRNRNEHHDSGLLEASGDAVGKEREILEKIQDSMFSTTRAKFLEQSQQIIDKVNKILDTPSTEDDDETDAEVEEGTESGDRTEAQSDESEAVSASPSTIDPAAYGMVRNKLREKQSIIKKGFRWAASSELLFAFSSLSESSEKLKRLAIGTIFYGQISSIQVWQILLAILPEYNASSISDKENTCASPWVDYCPPTQVRTMLGTEYPPSFLIDVAKTFCDEEALKFGRDGNDAPECSDSIDTIAESTLDLFGYTIPRRRNQENDPLHSMFAPIISLPIDAEGLESLEDTKEKLEAKKTDLTRSINDIWKAIGGKDGTELGRDGELHSIANECFEIVAGKYTYSACIFGKAQQKDGSSKTNLGKFKGIEYVDSDDSAGHTHTRILKWENGARCWNGPDRSATVHMKCGSKHKLISADEPDTCRYVFEMESYIACDESYKRLMGL